MKRHAPEDPDESPGPLFEAMERRDVGMSNALTSATARGNGWPERFVEAVRVLARSRQTFLAEDALAICPAPAHVTGRACGPLMKRAEKLGYIEHAGFAAAKTSNLSPKCLWRSRLFAGAVT